MSSCVCDSISAVVSLSGDDTTTFEQGFIRVETQDGKELRRCEGCGAHWQVDTGRDPLAIRIDEPKTWAEFDDRPIRLRVLVDKLGGLGLSHCMWQGCERRALKVSGVCPHHAFPRLSNEIDPLALG